MPSGIPGKRRITPPRVWHNWAAARTPPSIGGRPPPLRGNVSQRSPHSGHGPHYGLRRAPGEVFHTGPAPGAGGGPIA
ncbi:hypothetical protein Stsp01_31750 [Streptomyces sp. NBRC 13847]|nr:hypothetical protein Stsp01_31750 [Streptomyces sp. NBRC 13847]